MFGRTLALLLLVVLFSVLAGCAAEPVAPVASKQPVPIRRFEENPGLARHENPADSEEATESLSAARTALAHFETPERKLTTLVPICVVTGDLESATSVFDVTGDEGGRYIAAFCQGETLVGVIDWNHESYHSTAEWDSFYGDFYLDIPEAERKLEDDFGQAPEAVRYVGTFHGIWVIGRVGDVERGAFVIYQGLWDCWPSWNEVYSGDRVLDHLRHAEQYHSDAGQDCDPNW